MIVYILIGLAALIVLVYCLLILPTQWLKVEQVHYKTGAGIKVLQISDIHIEHIRIPARRLIQLIGTERPSYIVLTGDFTELAPYLSKVHRYIKELASTGVPMLAVYGNHDHHLAPAELQQLTKMLEEEGVRLLHNEVYAAGHYQFIGIDDWTSKKSDPDKAFAKADPTKPTIVLTHDPNVVLHIKQRFTYLMAGHFHGMQFHLPFLFKYLRKGALPAAGIYKGMHQMDNGMIYISKGISQTGTNARFLMRSEVTIHHL
ncbi:metallophosphoesterase [Paenibacillus sp. YAF4_2]|uniref:metallophosphoesterase n=1 Tax=Paenibacillus sp. YAF4_2 TaxID=3233085 RepID=UPI003F984B8C